MSPRGRNSVCPSLHQNPGRNGVFQYEFAVLTVAREESRILVRSHARAFEASNARFMIAGPFSP
jgi:hypothetical protein